MNIIGKPDTGGMERYFMLGAQSVAGKIHAAIMEHSRKQAHAQSFIGILDDEQAMAEGAKYALNHLEEIVRNLRTIQHNRIIDEDKENK